MSDIITETNRVKAGDLSNTPEEILATLHNVCGAQACRDAEDAKLILDYLGLIERKKP